MNNYYDAQLSDLPKSIPARENKALLLPVNRHRWPLSPRTSYHVFSNLLIYNQTFQKSFVRMLRYFKEYIYFSRFCGTVFKGRENKAAFWSSGIVIFIYRSHHTDQETVYFFWLPLFAVVWAFLGNIIYSMININSKLLSLQTVCSIWWIKKIQRSTEMICWN